MSKVVPITGRFTTPQALLACVMGEDNLEGVLVVGLHKDGTMHYGHVNVKRNDMVYACTVMAHKVVCSE